MIKNKNNFSKMTDTLILWELQNVTKEIIRIKGEHKLNIHLILE